MVRHGIFVLVLVAVGFGCIRLGERGAGALERLLADRVGNGLAVLRLDWAEIRADGLRLELHGHAPDLFARDLAMESARATAPIAMVIDYTTVSLSPPPVRPPIHLEMLRDARGLTLTGRFHGEIMRAGLIAALSAAAPGLEVHDLTGINAAQAPASWGPELEIATLAAARVPNAYVRIEPGEVRVEGLARDGDHREALSQELLALASDTVRLTLNLREPLRVVAPFVFAAVKDASGGIRLEACAARDFEEEAVLEALLRRAGIELSDRPCAAALGGPAGDWAGAVAAGLAALGKLPAGRIRLEYRAARLEAAAPTGVAELEAALVVLAAALPAGYVTLGSMAGGSSGRDLATARERYWMHLGRAPGAVVLSGAVTSTTMRRVIETYASARFGLQGVHSALTVAGSAAPAGWEAAAMVALDALAGLERGDADLSGRRIIVRGTAAGAAQAGRLHRLLEGEAPRGYAVKSDLTVDLPALVAAVPLLAPRCAVVLNAMARERPVVFDPGSAVIGTASRVALDRLAGILARCGSGRIEIGGHTDHQGSKALNRRLSRARAEAVVDAMIARGIALDRLAAQGYGEEHPVATNQTEAGRALNRRIEFTALQ